MPSTDWRYCEVCQKNTYHLIDRCLLHQRVERK